MATTTTNYGFDVPTSSDLVKNGATQIALLGQDLDTFLFRPFTRNLLLNSSFNVWQRGTSAAGAANSTTYIADRWNIYRGVAGSTFSRQVTGDTTNLPNIQYCMRVARDNANTSTSDLVLSQSMETVSSVPFAGQTITVSFYARKGANYSATSSILAVSVRNGTGTDQNDLAGYTGLNGIINSNATLTTTWQRFSYTATVPTNATELAARFTSSPTGTAGAADYYEITGVMLEVGSQASPYAPATSTYATELAACQRYYYRLTPGAAYNVFGSGFTNSTSIFLVTIPMPVSMRITPTALDQSGTASQYSVFQGTGGFTCSSVPSLYHGNPFQQVVSFTVTAGLVVGQAGIGRTDNNSTAYLGWTAEL
jgi:hypothetical protein